MHEKNVSKCGAKTRSGDPCKNLCVTGSNRCRMHGGKTPRGMANVNTLHGRYSKAIPTRLAERYEAMLADPQIWQLHDEMALVNARISELIGKLSPDDDVDDEADRGTWKEIGEHIETSRRLSDSERRHLEQMNQYCTVNEVMTMIAAITDVIRRHVQDRHVLKSMSEEIDKLINKD